MTENQIKLRATTILGVKKGERIAMGGDGQVTLADTIVKSKAVKVRKMDDGKVLAGFAGSAADGMTLFDKFEKKLEMLQGDLVRAAVELAKEWRNDKYLRRLEAQLAVMNHQHIFLISGNGDILEPDDDVIAIGSGGAYAKSAALALLTHSELSAKQIVFESLQIAASICIYTNSNIQVIEP